MTFLGFITSKNNSSILLSVIASVKVEKMSHLIEKYVLLVGIIVVSVIIIIKFAKKYATEISGILIGLASFFEIYRYSLGRHSYNGKGSWYYDLYFRNNMGDMISQGFTTFFSLVTNISSVYFFATVFAIFLFYLHKTKGQKKFAVILGANVTAAFIIGTVLKLLIGRERPGFSVRADAPGFSFPSLHAFTCSAYFVFLTYLVWYLGKKSYVKVLATICFVSIIFTVSFSRVYLGVHYESDVIAGISLGTALASAIALVLKLLGYFEVDSEKDIKKIEDNQQPLVDDKEARSVTIESQLDNKE